MMEIKKSAKADLERIRPQAFLLGVVLALASLFVAFEFSFEPEDPLDDPELLERMTFDEELAPLLLPEQQLAVLPKAQPEPSTVIKVVEDETVTPDEEQPLPDDVLEGEGGEEAAADEEQPEPAPAEPVVSFRIVEELPQFPGGYQEFVRWLTRNLKYPLSAQQRNVQGKVLAEFIVNKDGSVTDVRVVRSLDATCDREALRVLRSMPRWTAGIDHGQPCRTKVCIPIVFKL